MFRLLFIDCMQDGCNDKVKRIITHNCGTKIYMCKKHKIYYMRNIVNNNFKCICGKYMTLSSTKVEHV